MCPVAPLAGRSRISVIRTVKREKRRLFKNVYVPRTPTGEPATPTPRPCRDASSLTERTFPPAVGTESRRGCLLARFSPRFRFRVPQEPPPSCSPLPHPPPADAVSMPLMAFENLSMLLIISTFPAFIQLQRKTARQESVSLSFPLGALYRRPFFLGLCRQPSFRRVDKKK